jgi:cardiolipin synthase (CMP-forming)
MNIPNILTLFRIFLIPVFILVFFSNISNSLFIAILIFLIAGFTDILDGHIARKFNLITKFGMVLDPLADKLMLITVLACLSIQGYTSIWILIIVGAKELFMIVSAIFLYNDNTIIPSNLFGKISTFLFYLSIFILSLNISLGDYFLYAAVASSIIALSNYLILYIKNKSTISSSCGLSNEDVRK